MKKKLFALLLAFSLALSIPASALSNEDFQQGQLSGLAAAEDGALLVTDTYNKVIWRVEGDTVTRFAGTIGATEASGEPAAVYHDDAIDKAFFMEPWAIAPFLEGYAVSDTAANVVRYVAKGRVQTLAGSGKPGSSNGSGSVVSFNRPTGLAAGSDGMLYIADTGNGSIRCIDKEGHVTTVVTGLASPTGLCWSNGFLYVAETGRSRICRVKNKTVEAFAGVSEAIEDSEYAGGYADGPAASARFDHPQGLAAGADGTIYVSDTGNSAIRMIADGRVYTLARSSATALMPASPRGLLVRDGALLAADAFSGSILTVSLAQTTYRDVADEWFAPAVQAMTRRGITGGMGDNAFVRQANVSRAMFVTMLARLYQIADGSAILDGSATLSDIEADSWYAAAARWAIDQGIVTGSNGLLEPARIITREEMAAMLYRYADKQKLTLSEAGAGSALSDYTDASEISGWAVNAMRWACRFGMLNGSDGKLNPRAAATRAEAAAILLRFMDACSL